MPNRPAVHRLRPATPQGARAHAQDRRGTSCQRGYGYAWQQARLAFLRRHPLCAECGRQGRLTPATVVDHVTPHRGDAALLWDEGNWQPLCARCHGVKTAKGQ